MSVVYNRMGYDIDYTKISVADLVAMAPDAAAFTVAAAAEDILNLQGYERDLRSLEYVAGFLEDIGAGMV